MTTAKASVRKCCGINVIVSGGVPFFAVLSVTYGGEMLNPNACAATPFGRTVGVKSRPALQERDQT
jgi:hypothetical protein